MQDRAFQVPTAVQAIMVQPVYPLVVNLLCLPVLALSWAGPLVSLQTNKEVCAAASSPPTAPVIERS